LPEADLKVYDEQVANQALPSQQIGDVKKSDLPGLEALNVSGGWFNPPQIFAFVADEGNRSEAWRDEDGQEWRCCRSTPGRAQDLSSHEVNLTWGAVGLRLEPMGQDRDRR
jgi:hypothetical protein